MVVGLKESIPYDPVISRNNNYHNYLNEHRGARLILYLSERALVREGGGRGGRSHLSRALIKFFSCKEGHSFEGGVHLGRGTISVNYSNAAWLRDDLFECLDARIELLQNTFYFTF